jgi:hypothetical protein
MGREPRACNGNDNFDDWTSEFSALTSHCRSKQGAPVALASPLALRYVVMDRRRPLFARCRCGDVGRLRSFVLATKLGGMSRCSTSLARSHACRESDKSYSAHARFCVSSPLRCCERRRTVRGTLIFVEDVPTSDGHDGRSRCIHLSDTVSPFALGKYALLA